MEVNSNSLFVLLPSGRGYIRTGSFGLEQMAYLPSKDTTSAYPKCVHTTGAGMDGDRDKCEGGWRDRLARAKRYYSGRL